MLARFESRAVTYVINDVLASVCTLSERSALSRYATALLDGIATESESFKSHEDGSNSSATDVFCRIGECGGDSGRFDSALLLRKNEGHG